MQNIRRNGWGTPWTWTTREFYQSRLVVPAFYCTDTVQACHQPTHHKTAFFSLSHMGFSIFHVKRKSRKCWEQMEALQSLPITLCGALSPLTKSCPPSNSPCRQRTRRVIGWTSCASPWWGDKKGQQLKRRAFWFYPASTANNHHGRAKLPRSMIEWAIVREGIANLLRWQGNAGIYCASLRWVIPGFTAALVWLILLCSCRSIYWFLELW